MSVYIPASVRPTTRHYEHLSIVQALGIVIACALLVGVGVSFLPT